MNRTENNGVLAAAGAYLVWGLVPIYWKALASVPALQIGAHRLVWCALLVFGYLIAREGLSWFAPLWREPRTRTLLVGSGVLIGVNWWLYIWAVNSGHIVETSLGYFINPLVSVALGVFVLHERLNTSQKVAVAAAACGVLYLTYSFGRLPWIALTLALSFGGYGLLRKLAHVDSVKGLAFENSVLLLPALAILGWAHAQGQGAFLNGPARVDVLLALGGLVTAVPLVWFAYGARRIPLTMIGILQYIAPSLQLLCGVLIFGEAFTATHWIGFACIWSALAIYAADGLWRTRLRAAIEPA